MKKVLSILTMLSMASHAWGFRFETVSSNTTGVQSVSVNLTPAISQTATLIVTARIRSVHGTLDPIAFGRVTMDGNFLLNLSQDSEPYIGQPQAASNGASMGRTIAAAVTPGNRVLTITNTFTAESPWTDADFSVTALYPLEAGPLDLQMIADITDLDARVTILENIIPLIQNDVTSLQNAVTLLQSTLDALNFVTNVVLNPDGTTTYTYRNGTTYTANPDKVNPIVNVTQNVNGTQTYTYQDGTSYTTTPSTTNPIVSVVRNNDGTYTYTYEDGTTQTFAPLQSVKSVVQNTDGSITFTYLDGTTYTTSATAGVKTVVQNADGTTTYTYFDGTTYTTVAGLGPKGDTGATGASGAEGAPGGRGKKGKTGNIGKTGSSGDSGSNGAWWPGVVAGVGAGVIFWAVEESQDKKTAQGDLIEPPVNSVMVDPGLPAAYSAQGDVYKIQKQ